MEINHFWAGKKGRNENKIGCTHCFFDGLFLDTFDEKRRAFVFIINPLGIQMDAIRTEEGGNDRMDASWDTVFFLGMDNDLFRDDSGR